MTKIVGRRPQAAIISSGKASGERSAAAPGHLVQSRPGVDAKKNIPANNENSRRAWLLSIPGKTEQPSSSSGSDFLSDLLASALKPQLSVSPAAQSNNPRVGPHNVLAKPAPRCVNSTDDLYQELSKPSTAVAMMSSGGTRKAESGNTVSFFVRQSPESITASDWMAHYEPLDPLKPKPARVVRSTLPDELFTHAKRFDNLAKFNAESGIAHLQDNYHTCIPGVLRRAESFIRAKIEGKAPNGWKYDQKQAKNGQCSIVGSRLYASVKTKNVAGTEIALPTREIELYDLDRRMDLSETGNTIPKEVARIKVLLPENDSIVPLNKAGVVTRKAVVNCHELGNKYVLYRSDAPNIKDEKRKLTIYAHGAQSPYVAPMMLPEGIKLSFYCADGEVLVTQGKICSANLDAKYSTHELAPESKNGKYLPFSYVTKSTGTEIGGDGAFDGTIADLQFSKIGSPIHEPKRRTVNLLNNSEESAAWAAHDNDVDVLTLRHAASRKGEARLSDVLEQLKIAGLDTQYDEIQVVSCRSPSSVSLATPVGNFGVYLDTPSVRFEI